MSATTDPAKPVDKSDEKVRDMFGEIAPKYDRMNHLLSMNVDRYWRWQTVRKLKPIAGQPILDVCTGTGDLAISFLKKTKGQSKIVAADFCPEMLEIGDKKRQKLGQKSDCLSFVEADTQDLPFENDSFHIVSVAFGLRNVSNTMKGLQEMTRVCQPGGKVAVLEFSMPRRWPVSSAYRWYFKHILPRVGQALARNDSNAYEYLPDSVGEFPAYEELAEIMMEAGLSSARFYPLTAGVATLYVGVK